MTAVVCAAFDPVADEAVYAVRDLVREAGIPLPPRPPHRPHVTLSAARVDDVEPVLAVAAHVASRHAPIQLTLSEVGRFGRAGALWLGPRPTPGLAALQRDVAESLGAHWPAAFGERSEPQGWVPHCTLATRVAKPLLRDVQRAVRVSFAPIPATVAGLATILVGGRGDVGYTPLASRDLDTSRTS